MMSTNTKHLVSLELESHRVYSDQNFPFAKKAEHPHRQLAHHTT